MSEYKDEILVATNKKAKFNYFLSDFQEAGIVLLGSEIKALRAGHCSLDDSYVIIKEGELFILNMNIPVYQAGSSFTHEPTRSRKLLMHKKQIFELERAVEREGYTLIPARVYIRRGHCKVQIALAKGKKNYDKRETVKKRDIERKIAKAVKERY